MKVPIESDSKEVRDIFRASSGSEPLEEVETKKEERIKALHSQSEHFSLIVLMISIKLLMVLFNSLYLS